MIMKRALYGLGLAAIATVLVACGNDTPRGTVISVTETAVVPAASVDVQVAGMGLAPLIGAASKCGVVVDKVVYQTVGPKGKAEKASAGLMTPSSDADHPCAGPYPVVLYHHATQLLKAYTGSDLNNVEAALQMAFFASQGYVVVMPDYLGYGDSTLTYTPFLDADNTAAVSIDALRAARVALTNRKVLTNDKLYLTGYSQGGHAAMATQKVMERDFPTEFTITSAVDMSGPYALSDTFLGMFENPPASGPIFFTMGLVGMQKVYGNVYDNPADVFQAPYATWIESLIPGTWDYDDIYAQNKLPLALTGTGGLLTDSFVAGYQASETFPARLDVAKNDLLNWKPKAPLTLCGGDRDPTVPFATNTVAASIYFLTQSVTVPVVNVEQIPDFQPVIAALVGDPPDLTNYHSAIVPPLCMSYAKMLFEAL